MVNLNGEMAFQCATYTHSVQTVLLNGQKQLQKGVVEKSPGHFLTKGMDELQRGFTVKVILKQHKRLVPYLKLIVPPSSDSNAISALCLSHLCAVQC